MDQRWQNSTPTVKDQFKYGYDRASNRTWRENTLRHNGGGDPKLDEFYTYDGLDRLETMKRGTLTGSPPYTGIADTPANEEDWTLDALGNWKGFRVDDDSTLDWDVLDQTRLHNKVNEIDDDNDHLPGDPINEGTITETQGDSWVVPGFDAAGNMLSGPKPGDEETRQHYKWDAWNRMVAVYADDDGEVGDLIATYRYDGLNRRIKKIAEVAEVTYDYYYNEAWQLVETHKDGDLLEQYVWDQRYIDAPVLRWHDLTGDEDFDDSHEVLYYTNDANMNVTALVDASDGSVVERVVYDPYGKPKFYDGSWANPSDTSAYDNAILYCGYYFDQESGLYHVRNRYYDFALGRWSSWDPSRYVDAMSLYCYVVADPVSRRDPQGTQSMNDLYLGDMDDAQMRAASQAQGVILPDEKVRAEQEATGVAVRKVTDPLKYAVEDYISDQKKMFMNAVCADHDWCKAAGEECSIGCMGFGELEPACQATCAALQLACHAYVGAKDLVRGLF